MAKKWPPRRSHWLEPLYALALELYELLCDAEASYIAVVIVVVLGYATNRLGASCIPTYLLIGFLSIEGTGRILKKRTPYFYGTVRSIVLGILRLAKVWIERAIDRIKGSQHVFA